MVAQRKTVASLTTDHGSPNTTDADYSKSGKNSTAAQRQAIYRYLASGRTLTKLFAEDMGLEVDRLTLLVKAQEESE